VEVCEHTAIEVISLEEGTLKGFEINQQACKRCDACIQEGFCLNDLFQLQMNDETGKEEISFTQQDLSNCFKCLKCFKSCPNNAIIPIIEEE